MAEKTTGASDTATISDALELVMRRSDSGPEVAIRQIVDDQHQSLDRNDDGSIRQSGRGKLPPKHERQRVAGERLISCLNATQGLDLEACPRSPAEQTADDHDAIDFLARSSSNHRDRQPIQVACADETAAELSGKVGNYDLSRSQPDAVSALVAAAHNKEGHDLPDTILVLQATTAIAEDLLASLSGAVRTMRLRFKSVYYLPLIGDPVRLLPSGSTHAARGG
jgi:hypothetical protein